MTTKAGDEHMGYYVYCASHLRPHSTGWCTVDPSNKIRLAATNYDDAAEECDRLGLHIDKHGRLRWTDAEKQRYGLTQLLTNACEGRHYRSWLTSDRQQRDDYLRRLAGLRAKEGAL